MVVIFNLDSVIVVIIGIFLSIILWMGLTLVNFLSLSPETYFVLGILISSLVSEFKGLKAKLFFMPLDFISILLTFIVLAKDIGDLSLIFTLPLLIQYFVMRDYLSKNNKI